VHVVVPDGIDDPARPSGGNAFDRQVCRGLERIGWSIRENAVPGTWPRPDAAALATLAGVLERIPDDSVVLVDGLVASAAPEILVPQAGRLRLVVLMHMPLGDRPAADGIDDARGERSGPLGRRLRRHHERLDPAPAAGALRAAGRPGARRRARCRCADLATGTSAGRELLCVAAVTSDKGHDVLLDALATTADLAVALRLRRQPGS
jgi:hypothetical protein